MKYTHTDLKPENILFIDSDYESVYDKRAGMTVRNVISPRVKVVLRFDDSWILEVALLYYSTNFNYKQPK